MKKTLKFAAFALALTTTFATASGDGWMTDFAAAKKKAASEKKDLLVDFTGSDWCGWCMKLNKEVFQHDAFKKGVADKFVLVEIDFPRDKSKQSDALQKQNAELQKSYQVAGFPTILLMDSQGRPFANTGYRAGGPEKYLEHLKELQSKRIKRDEALAAAEKLSGVAKAKALVAVLEDLPEDYLGHYQSIIDEIAKLDPKDESGFVAQQKKKQARKELEQQLTTAMRSGKSETAPAIIDKFIADQKLEGKEKQDILKIKLQINVGNVMRTGDVDKAVALVDTYITDNKVSGEEKQEVLGYKIGPYLNAKKFDQATKVLDDIIAINPESRTAKFAEQFKPKLKQMKEAAAKQPTEQIEATKIKN